MGFVLPSSTYWGGYEMESRGTLNAFWGGMAIAIPSGAGVAFSVISSSSSMVMVGLAIAAALLPPLVNTGLNISYGLVLYYDVMSYSRVEEGKGWLMVALWSFLLFVVNMIFVYLTALIVFWVKKVKPIIKKRTLISEHGTITLNTSYSKLEYDRIMEEIVRPNGDSGPFHPLLLSLPIFVGGWNRFAARNPSLIRAHFTDIDFINEADEHSLI
eukprot:TRINITY_DN3778_c0_g1_i1.p1 TRINITY_DN3778_c0_g1~~TRINITY_DN3778_c0_g1_i1.p1  ORF type:complete len:225 (-),score=8.70 TRINITY_DN3778_c0_g1_i1:352-993(-)